MTLEQHQAREAVRHKVQELSARLDAISALCRRYNHPGSSPAAHALANKILSIAEPETKREYQ